MAVLAIILRAGLLAAFLALLVGVVRFGFHLGLSQVHDGQQLAGRAGELDLIAARLGHCGHGRVGVRA